MGSFNKALPERPMLNLTESWFKKRVKRGTFLWAVLNGLKDIVKVTPIVVPIYRKITKNSIFIFRDELAAASTSPLKLIDKTIELFNPKTVLDLGCGTGKSLDYFHSQHIEVVGVEGSKIAISEANHPELILKYNLEKELKLNRKFGLIWSFEFVEHIHPKFVNNLLKTFSNHSDRVVLSAARPGQGGDGHFNEQPPSYWIEKFEKHGYRFDRAKTDELRLINEEYAENMLVFER